MNSNICERVFTFYKQLIGKTAPTPMVLTYVCFENGRPRHRCQVARHTEGLLVRPLHCLHQPFREPDLLITPAGAVGAKKVLVNEHHDAHQELGVGPPSSTP